MTHTNPILKGFNPDPSIIRVGSDYYIATSTFEWFPGVQIHHSKDLVHWTLLTHPLDHVNSLDIKGVPDSCGVWAPCLSYCDDTFYLVYSAVRSFDGMYKDTPNYLITANDIMGPWSEPIFLDSSGFDGSLFHDDDGKKYYLSLLVDHRDGLFFGGIMLQEYSSDQKKLIGNRSLIFRGSTLGITEGPHLYKKEGWYYLITAEGGTEYGHAVTVARSRDLLGPYELHPEHPLLTSVGFPENPLQKTGHGDLIWTEDGQCYLVFLTGRPLPVVSRCILGRESAIEEVLWKEGWPYLANHNEPARLDIPGLPERKEARQHETLRFEKDTLSIHYQSLRIPQDESWMSYDASKGCLKLAGRESLSSTFEQSLLARRLQHFEAEFSISLKFSPTHFQHMAGLVCYYNTGHHYYLHITGDAEKGGCWLKLLCQNNFAYHELIEDPISIEEDRLIYLKVEWISDTILFYYKLDDRDWHPVGPGCDASILSDDYVRDGSDRYRPAFTGSFVGFCCQDLTGHGHLAEFYSCEYREF